MEEETLGIIEEVFPSDEDVINDLPETNDIEEPEDDPTIPTEDQDTGDPGGDTTPIEMELGELIEPDSGDVVSASEDIVLEDEEVVAEEHETTPLLTNIESLPTIGHVQEGDRVMIALVGGEPTVLGTVGSGDAQQAAIDAHEAAIAQQEELIQGAVDMARAAEEVASATGQHFWYDTNGAHVTEITKEEWEDNTKSKYHTGSNVLLNSIGMVFRKALDPILSLITGKNPGVVMYDGKGSSEENIIASFTGEGYQIGPNSSVHQVGNGSAVTFYDESGKSIAYISTDKFFSVNAEMQDSLYISNYSFRKANDGKLVIGLRS